MSEQPRAPLVLAPFRGLRFDPGVVGDLGSVISPPYDVLDSDTVRDLEAGNHRNIVRLILSRSHERPYLTVRRRLEQWRSDGCLVADPQPALYLYEYSVDATTVRGLLGLVALRDETEGVVLPHEDVMPGPVDDRAALMRATCTNLEPILLVHESGPRWRDLMTTAPAGEPLVSFRAADRSDHRLWALTDPSLLAELAWEMQGGRALIADGHHRYAAYLRLQRELRDPGAPRDSSPWDFGLAMLVDQDEHSLSVGPIHRSVTGLTLSDVVEVSAARGDRLGFCRDRESALAHLDSSAAGDAVFALSDGRQWAVLTTLRHHDVDAGVLHDELFPAWEVAEGQVAYHHSLEQALQTMARSPGVAVAVRPPRLSEVVAAAAAGRRMPRKSTSFNPKPRMGLVMRDLRDA